VKEPVWIGLRDALAVHDRLLALYGGAEGIRDQNLLESALARPRQVYAYADNPELEDLGVALVTGVVKNHPFVDGNKRTGFVVGVMFLELNGLQFTATEEDATQAVRLLAAGSLDESSFKNWLCDNVSGSAKRRSKKKV
jgi:death on curing protein